MQIEERNNPTQEYYNQLNGGLVIGFDYDNTCVIDEWPESGETVEGAPEVLNNLLRHGHHLILFTQRNNQYPECCPELAVFADEHGYNPDGSGTINLFRQVTGWIVDNLDPEYELFDVNKNSLWEVTTKDRGRKVYMDYLIDDHNVGMKYKTVKNRRGEVCKVVDWKFVDQWFVEQGVYPERVLSD